MISHPISVVVFSDVRNQKQIDLQLSELLSTIRPYDEVIVALIQDPSQSNPAPKKYAQRVKYVVGECLSVAVSEAVESSKSDLILVVSNRTFVTKFFLDKVRVSSLAARGALVGPRARGLPGYQGVSNIIYSGRHALREVAYEWSSTHLDLYSSSPFITPDAIWATKNTLVNLLNGITSSTNSVDFAWNISKRGSDTNTSIVVDDSLLVHVESPPKYELRIQYLNETSCEQPKYTKIAQRTGAVSAAIQERGTISTEVIGLSMIVRDEEQVLKGALGSAKGIVESLCVLDTGSKDKTIEVAAKAGAVVGHFEWINDFGKARQVALNMTNADWVLVLDADEELVVDSSVLMQELSDAVGLYGAFTVEIVNVDANSIGTSVRNQMARLLRRVDACWRGQIHEQVHARSKNMVLAGVALESTKILHSGYSNHSMESKSKVERNLILAEEFAAREGTLEAKIHLSRSLVLAGKIADSIEIMSEIAYDKALDPGWLPVAYRHLIDNNLGIGQITEAKKWHIEFKTRFPHRSDQKVREMLILCSIGRVKEALEIYKQLPIQESYVGDIQFSKSFHVAYLVNSLEGKDLYLEAISVVLSSLEESGFLDFHPGQVIKLLEKANISPYEFYTRMPKEKRVVIFGLILQLGMFDPDSASRFLLGLWQANVRDDLVLACAQNFVTQCSFAQILEWAVIFRTHRPKENCPLILGSREISTRLERRVALLFMAWVSFGDPDALEDLSVVVRELPIDERIALHSQLLSELGFDLQSVKALAGLFELVAN